MIYRDVKQFIRAKLNNRKQLFVYSQHRKYIRICAGFDIETTRIGDYAFMYHWQLSWDNDVLLLRKWSDFELLLQRVNAWLEPKKARLLLWVANMSHEFSFLCRRFEWSKIFARESRQPLTAVTGRIEFRECLSISGQGGLANLARNYCKTQKKLGDLDYTKPRNSQTELTAAEELYCVNDVVILSEWADYIFRDFSDKKLDIPLTSAGIIRSEIKAAAEETGQIEQIRAAVNHLYPDRDTYNYIMKYLFRGGFTHANIWYICCDWPNTLGVDFKSSYPAVMLQSGLCYYPMTKFISCTCDCDGKELTDEKLLTRCMLLVVDFDGIEAKTYHSIESDHKIIATKNAVFDNGRLRSADKIRVLITEIDYKVYQMFYKWEKLTVVKSLCAKRGKLPNYVTKPLQRYFIMKEALKKAGKGDTIEYQNAKARLNSFYGCLVTRLNFTEFYYNQGAPFELELEDGSYRTINTGEWYEKPSKKTYDSMIKKQILSPYWGIYVTSWARFRILSLIAKMDSSKDDYNVLYCDTDSIYFDDTPRNRKIVEEWNRDILKYNKENLPPEFKKLGCLEWINENEDGSPVVYRFKTLGAKRYIKHWNQESEVTVSGMKKGSFEQNIMQPFATDQSYPIFEEYEAEDGSIRKKRLGFVDVEELFLKFTDEFLLCCEDSLKLCSKYDTEPARRGADHHTYCDEYSAEVTDEQGHTETMSEKSGVALVPIPFKINMAEMYLILITQVLEERRRPCKL